MKKTKIILTGLLVIVLSVCASGQTLADFNKAHSHTITYDEDFNPTLHLTIKNVSNKTITTVEISVDYVTDAQRLDITKHPEVRLAKTNIPPMNSATVHINVPREKYYTKPQHFWISNIRFSDGTICDK